MSPPNYRITLSFDGERKVFVARAPELSHCSAEGATRAEAVAALEVEIEAQLTNMRGHGTAPPLCVDEQVVTGVVQAKVTQGLHRELLWQARQEGVELDHLVGELLAAGLEGRKSQRAQRPSGNRAPDAGNAVRDGVGNERGGRGPGPAPGNRRYQSNTQLLDDRANFIEYVRNLDQGQGQGRGSAPGGGNPGGRHRHDSNNRRRRGGAPPNGGQGGSGPSKI